MDDLFSELSAQARMQIITAAARRRMHYLILNVGAVKRRSSRTIVASSSSVRGLADRDGFAWTLPDQFFHSGTAFMRDRAASSATCAPLPR